MDDFAEFYLSGKDAVFRAVLAAGGDRAGAEDAVAEAYARACARWEAVCAHPNPTAWVLEGDLFLLWAPEGGLKHALVRAHRADDMLVDSGPRFGTPDGMDATEQACRQLGASFAELAGTPALPPRRHVTVYDDGQVSMYVADGMISVCTRDDGSLSMVSVSRTTGGAWQPLRYVHQACETSGWIVGVAPRFATSGTLTLSGGRTVPLVVVDGWFTAAWKGKQAAGQPEKIEIVAPGEVWTEQAGQVTRLPR
jgi:hypothetical protein